MDYDNFLDRWGRTERTAPVSEYRFQQRNAVLQSEGFLWWERFWLCQHNISSKAMMSMRNDRKKAYAEFDVKFETYNDWTRQVKQFYKDLHSKLVGNTDFRGGSGLLFQHNKRFSPLALLDFFKRRLPPGTPDTPQKRKVRPKSPESFKSKAERSIDRDYESGRTKYPRGKAYN